MISKIKNVYVAAAIDHVEGGEDPFEWMKKKLAPAQCFNPKAAFAGDCNRNLAEVQDFICSINFHAMQRADVIVAYTDLSTFSFGMPMELFYAALINKPVVLLLPEDKKPGVYAQFFSAKIITPDKLDLKVLEEVHYQFHDGATNMMFKNMKKEFLARILGGK